MNGENKHYLHCDRTAPLVLLAVLIVSEDVPEPHEDGVPFRAEGAEA
jgi:hypothetical protein